MDMKPLVAGSEVVESSLGNVFKNVLMLLVDDLFDCISQRGAVQEICIVCSPRSKDLPRFINDGFDAMGTRPLVLCLDMEHQTIVFDGCVLSRHCLNFIQWTSLVARYPAADYIFPVPSVREFERIEDSPYFVAGGTGFLCFIFLVAREGEGART